MQVGFDRRCFAALLALVTATAASAMPTATDCSDAHLTYGPPANLSYHVTVAAESSGSSELVNSNLARVAAELLAPPTAHAETQAFGDNVKPLPPVPAAVLMVITGFLCVSLVKDRRIWFAALTGLLSLGQAGVSVLPELVYHLAGRKQTEQHSPGELTRRMRVWQHSRRSRSDVEGTRYIGLLRRLAGIPDERRSLSASILSTRTMRGNFNSPGVCRSSTEYENVGCAVTQLISHLISTTTRPGSLSGQPFVFSPGFIFANLARGPPEPAWTEQSPMKGLSAQGLLGARRLTWLLFVLFWTRKH